MFQHAPFDVVAVRFPLVIGPDDYTHRFTFHVDRIKQGLPIGIDHPKARYSFISSADAMPQDRSPYALPTSLSVDTTNARAAGFSFESLDSLLDRLLIINEQ